MRKRAERIRTNGLTASTAARPSSRRRMARRTATTAPGACGAAIWTIRRATAPPTVAAEWSRWRCGRAGAATGLSSTARRVSRITTSRWQWAILASRTAARSGRRMLPSELGVRESGVPLNEGNADSAGAPYLPDGRRFCTKALTASLGFGMMRRWNSCLITILLLRREKGRAFLDRPELELDGKTGFHRRWRSLFWRRTHTAAAASHIFFPANGIDLFSNPGAVIAGLVVFSAQVYDVGGVQTDTLDFLFTATSGTAPANVRLPFTTTGGGSDVTLFSFSHTFTNPLQFMFVDIQQPGFLNRRTDSRGRHSHRYRSRERSRYWRVDL